MIHDLITDENFILKKTTSSTENGYEINIDEYYANIKITSLINGIKISTVNIDAESIYLSETTEKIFLSHYIADTEAVIDLYPSLSKNIKIVYNNTDECIYIMVEYLIPSAVKPQNQFISFPSELPV